jgi:hypothetical protein
LAPQVQFLRGFRDGHIMSTVSGSSFMNVFNSWYYSFSPAVADYERGQPWMQAIVRVLVQPLLAILTISEKGYSSFDGEYGAISAGFIASSLIGAVYFSPVAVAAKAQRRYRKLSLIALAMIAASLTLMVAGIVSGSSILLMTTTASFVLSVLAGSAIFTSKLISLFANRIKDKGLVQGLRQDLKRMLSLAATAFLIASIVMATSAPNGTLPTAAAETKEDQLQRLREIQDELDEIKRLHDILIYDINGANQLIDEYIVVFDTYMEKDYLGDAEFASQAHKTAVEARELSTDTAASPIADRHFAVKDNLSSAAFQLGYAAEADAWQVGGGGVRSNQEYYNLSLQSLDRAIADFQAYKSYLQAEIDRVTELISEIDFMPEPDDG